MTSSSLPHEDQPAHFQDWGQRLMYPLVGAGGAILVIAAIVGVFNQQNGAEVFGGDSSLGSASSAVKELDVGALRSFLTIDAWLPAFALFGVGIIVAGVGAAVGHAITTMRRESRQTQIEFGHFALAPADDSAARLLPVLMLGGLGIVGAAFVGAVVRASYVSRFFDSVKAGGDGSMTDIALLGRAQASGAWLPALQLLGIGVMLAAIVFGLIAIVELHRFNGWRMRDMTTLEPQETPGEMYVVTRSL